MPLAKWADLRLLSGGGIMNDYWHPRNTLSRYEYKLEIIILRSVLRYEIKKKSLENYQEHSVVKWKFMLKIL